MSKLNNIDNMVSYMCAKYRHLDPESTKDIITNFMKVCKHEMLNGNSVHISKIGTFCVKQKAQKIGTTIFKKKRIVPQMKVPHFRTSSTFRDYINGV